MRGKIFGEEPLLLPASGLRDSIRHAVKGEDLGFRELLFS